MIDVSLSPITFAAVVVVVVVVVVVAVVAGVVAGIVVRPRYAVAGHGSEPEPVGLEPIMPAVQIVITTTKILTR